MIGIRSGTASARAGDIFRSIKIGGDYSGRGDSVFVTEDMVDKFAAITGDAKWLTGPQVGTVPTGLVLALRPLLLPMKKLLPDIHSDDIIGVSHQMHKGSCHTFKSDAFIGDEIFARFRIPNRPLLKGRDIALSFDYKVARARGDAEILSGTTYLLIER